MNIQKLQVSSRKWLKTRVFNLGYEKPLNWKLYVYILVFNFLGDSLES